MHLSSWLDSASRWNKEFHSTILGKVKYVFGAGEHFFDIQKLDGINYITTGSPPCPYGADGSPQSLFHFLLVDIDENGTTLQVVPVKPLSIKGLDETEMSQKKAHQLLRNTVDKEEFLQNYDRTAMLRPQKIVNLMDIRPGENILDIGAGSGFFSFRFAKELEGAGMVYATDMDTSMISIIERKLEKSDYRNTITPVLVTREGLDPFYKEHSFDKVFLCEVYQNMLHPEEFFKELRPSLKENARVYIIHWKTIYNFSEVEFPNFRRLLKLFSTSGEDFPVFKRLSKKTREFILRWDGKEVPNAIEQKMIGDFNNMLSDTGLCKDMLNYYGYSVTAGNMPAFEKFLDKLDGAFVKWLYINLYDSGILNGLKTELTEDEEEELFLLNRHMLDGFLKCQQNLANYQGQRPYVKKNSLIMDMETAGYKFVREHDFLNYYYFLEFSN